MAIGFTGWWGILAVGLAFLWAWSVLSFLDSILTELKRLNQAVRNEIEWRQ